MRKQISRVITIAFAGGALFFLIDSDRPKAQIAPQPGAAQVKKMPDVIILAKESKNGPVTFNHVKHNGGEYSIGGPIACIECHHTAQPASQLAKYPPLKTDWPTGRKTTLTAELFAQDSNGAGVAACRDCHARTGEKPKLLAELPIIKDPDGTILNKMTNQMAFHQACDACHFQISMNRVGSKVPNATTCSACHKRTQTS